MTFPPQTLLALLGTAVSDAFGGPFEYHQGAATYASMSMRYGRYLDGHTDCRLPIRRCRTPGLYSDDTQQALVLLWVWAKMTEKGKVPARMPDLAGDLFIRACRMMATYAVPQEALSFGVHRGTGKNFRDAVIRGPVDTAGLGAAMRVGPVATLFEDAASLFDWIVAVSRTTTTNPIALAGAALYAQVVWGISLGDAPSYEVPKHAPATLRDAWQAHVTALDLLRAHGEVVMLEHVNGSANRKLGCAADGFALAGVPWVLWCLEVADNFPDALLRVCASGGDTDTVCAMVGAAAACRFGQADIPTWMVDNLIGQFEVTHPDLWHPILSEYRNVEYDAALRAELVETLKTHRSP